MKKQRAPRGSKPPKLAPIPQERGDVNVFINESFVIPVARKKADGYKPVEENGQVKFKHFGFNEEYTSFTKVFITPAAKTKFRELSLRAKEMILHIIHNLPAGKTKIKIEKESYCEMYDIKSTTFINTKMELMEKHIILDVKKEKDMFWINPFYFFCGNRLTTFEPFIKVEYEYFHDNYKEELSAIKERYWNSQLKLDEE